MPIRRLLFGAIVMVASLITSCKTICSACSAADTGIVAANNESQGPTVEVRGHSYPDKSFVPKAVTIHVTRGNVFVTVVEPEDANHVRVLARDVMLTDNLAESKFIIDNVVFNQDGAEMVDIAPGEGVPRLDAYIYVRKDVPIQIDADQGNVRVSGNTGTLTARADGSIEVNGATQNLDLATRGDNHGITVNGAHNQLTLRTDNGPIEITADGVNINAATGKGDILFVGQLLSGASYFTTTANSNITVVTYRFDVYAIDAATTANTIDVQYPAIADGNGLGNPVCGVFNSGSPYIMRLDDHNHRDRGQVTINMGDVRAASPVRLIGLVTPNYFVFNSSARNVLLEAPSVSEFFIETNFNDPVAAPTAVPVVQSSQPVTPTQAPPPPTPVQEATIPPEIMQSFMQATIAPAVELSPGQVQMSQSPVTPGALMYSIHCPVTERRPERVKIVANSGGGHIRIYQNLPYK
jgi:lipopolysaccharide export system protein LptA